MWSAGTYVFAVLALVFAARFEPRAHAGTPERDACVATTRIASICVSKRVEAPAPDGRSHAEHSKLLGLPRRRFALAEPERAPVPERRWCLARDPVAAPPVPRSARAPPAG